MLLLGQASVTQAAALRLKENTTDYVENHQAHQQLSYHRKS